MTCWRERVLDPTGGAERAADTTLVPRPSSFRGTTLGLLDNGKPNGAVLLGEVGRRLAHRFDLRDVRTFTKSYFGTPVERTQVEEIVGTCNFAVTAIGD